MHQVSLYIEEHRTELEAEAGKDKLQVMYVSTDVLKCFKSSKDYAV